LTWSTMVLMVSFSSRISPRTSTVIFFDRSPPATAVVTSAMLRTCAVRFDAIELTLSVKSFQVPATPCTSACPPSFPSVPTSRATRVTSAANDESWSTMVLMVFLSSRISPFTSTVIFFDRSPVATAVVTSAMLRTCAVRLLAIEFTLSVRCLQVLASAGMSAGPARLAWVPASRPSLHVRLPAELALRTHFTRRTRYFRREGSELVHHGVDGVLELQDLALHIHRDLLRQVARRNRSCYIGDVANLRGQVAGHRV